MSTAAWLFPLGLGRSKVIGVPLLSTPIARAVTNGAVDVVEVVRISTDEVIDVVEVLGLSMDESVDVSISITDEVPVKEKNAVADGVEVVEILTDEVVDEETNVLVEVVEEVEEAKVGDGEELKLAGVLILHGPA